MSTKGLIADKRVLHVQLDEKGKAAVLTLNEGWTYNGSVGPFPLTSVTHGHEIVKAAIGIGAAGAQRAPRAIKAQPIDLSGSSGPSGFPSTRTKPMQSDEASSTGSIPPKVALRPDHSSYVYRWEFTKIDGTHTIAGWLKAGRPWTMEMLCAHAIESCASRVPDASCYASSGKRWTKAMQTEAIKAGTMGSPYALEDHREGE